MNQEVLDTLELINLENGLKGNEKLTLDGHPRCAIVTISPDMAKEILQFNFSRNRNMSADRIKTYVKEIQNGQWGLSTDAIGIDQNGELINGQHRLNAVVNSGDNATFLMVVGLPSESVMYLDGGLKRNPAMQMRLHTEDKLYWKTSVVAFVRTLSSMKCGGNVRTLSTYDVYDLIEKYYYLCKHFDRKKPRKAIKSSDMYACLYAGLGTRKFTYEQMEAYLSCVNGVGTFDNVGEYNYHAALKFREWYLAADSRPQANAGNLYVRHALEGEISKSIYMFMHNVKSVHRKNCNLYPCNENDLLCANEIVKEHMQ